MNKKQNPKRAGNSRDRYEQVLEALTPIKETEAEALTTITEALTKEKPITEGSTNTKGKPITEGSTNTKGKSCQSGNSVLQTLLRSILY